MNAPSTKELARKIGEVLTSGESHIRRGPLWIFRAESPTAPMPALYTPMFCVVAQGAKEIVLGSERYTYGPGNFLLNSVAVRAECSGRPPRALASGS